MYWRRHVRDIVLAAAFVAAASTVVAASTPDADETSDGCAVGPPGTACVRALQEAPSPIRPTGRSVARS